MENSALLILDMQNYFLEKTSNAFIPSAKCIIPNIQKTIKVFKNNNSPVIFTKHINTAENAGMMEKWWHNTITEDFIISDFDTTNCKIIEKPQYDAFYNTDLEVFLKSKSVENLIITGVMTHLCCETTARSAFVKGYNILFLIDATATYNELFHQSTLLNLAHGFTYPITTTAFLGNIREN